MSKRKSGEKNSKPKKNSPMKSRITDPLGSYTGAPAKDDEPVQDADDL